MLYLSCTLSEDDKSYEKKHRNRRVGWTECREWERGVRVSRFGYEQLSARSVWNTFFALFLGCELSGANNAMTISPHLIWASLFLTEKGLQPESTYWNYKLITKPSGQKVWTRWEKLSSAGNKYIIDFLSLPPWWEAWQGWPGGCKSQWTWMGRRNSFGSQAYIYDLEGYLIWDKLIVGWH